MGNRKREYGITRREDNRSGTQGWEVGIGRDGRIVGRSYFSDRLHGGNEASLEAARKFRDAVLEKFPPLPRSVISQRLRSNNTSGHPGVHAVRKQGRLLSYCAQTKLPDGVVLTSYFNVRQHGQTQAFALAIGERRKQLRKVSSRVLLSPQADHLIDHAPATPDLEALLPRRPERRKKQARTRYPTPPSDLVEQIAAWRRQGPSLKWICRFRSSWGTPGWRVCIRRGNRTLALRTFMDSQHGGWKSALRMAKRFRDTSASELGLKVR